MGTVSIVKFSEDKTTFDWIHEDGSGLTVAVGSLTHPLDREGAIDKTRLIVECDECGIQSMYPMSGGLIAQELHRNHLLQDSLANVQADAVARSIDTTDKTIEQLTLEIIQDECIKKDVPYLL